MKAAAVLTVIAVAAVAVFAQDPAPGWLSYATAKCPAGQRMTHFEGQWQVPSNPSPSFAFFSPWIGADTSDNLCLIQPVNPWLGNSWAAYTEYYQWSNSYNRNSASIGVNAGDTMHGVMSFNDGAEQSYTITQTDVTTGQSSSMTIPVQKENGKYKTYEIQYVVFEKVAQCNQYPPNGKVSFTNLIVKCNNVTVTPQWSTGVVDEVCDFKATVVSPSQIDITWNPASDKNPTPEQLLHNRAGLKRRRMTLGQARRALLTRITKKQ